MAVRKLSNDEQENFPDFFGPGQVDNMVRQAIHMCWISLPKEKRSVEEVEKQMRRIFERAIKDHREDGDAFKRP